MHVKFKVPAASGLSVTQYRDKNIDLYIKASSQETLSIEMDEETAVKIGYALLKITGRMVEEKSDG